MPDSRHDRRPAYQAARPTRTHRKLTTIMAPDANPIDQPDNGPASDTDARRSGDDDRDSRRQTDAGDHDRSDDDDQETEQELGVEKMRDCDGDLASDGGHSLEGECWGPATASLHRIPSRYELSPAIYHGTS